MIEDSIKIHDNFSVEIKSIYENIFKKRTTKYDTITYLFIPSGLNINPQTYTKSKFYNDVKVYVRYKASNYTLDDILELETSPLKKLDLLVYQLVNGKNVKKNSNELVSAVKMLGAILKNTFHTETNLVKDEYKSENLSLASTYLSKVKSILFNYRLHISSIENLKFNEDLIQVMKFGDEYISNITNFYLIHLYEFYMKFNVDKKKLKDVVKFLTDEQKYRKVKKYDVVNGEDYFDETLLYKRSQLKKYIESVLFLNREIRKDGAFVEQSIFAAAAGLAMIFSTGVAFYYQQIYGNFTLPFFIALVVGYMFKDRIKWAIGLMFVSKASSFFYDYKVKIRDPENNIIGRIKENFTFVPSKNLGPKVKKHRMFNAEYDLNFEQIVQYKKKIIIYPKKFGKEISDDRLDSLVDITRINFYRFIPQMDNPKKKYSIAKKGKIIKRVGNKNYHIQIIQKFYSEKGIEFKRYCVIMNRNGIKRIEKVLLKNSQIISV
jgi:hypothetical protein